MPQPSKNKDFLTLVLNQVFSASTQLKFQNKATALFKIMPLETTDALVEIEKQLVKITDKKQSKYIEQKLQSKWLEVWLSQGLKKKDQLYLKKYYFKYNPKQQVLLGPIIEKNQLDTSTFVQPEVRPASPLTKVLKEYRAHNPQDLLNFMSDAKKLNKLEANRILDAVGTSGAVEDWHIVDKVLDKLKDQNLHIFLKNNYTIRTDFLNAPPEFYQIIREKMIHSVDRQPYEGSKSEAAFNLSGWIYGEPLFALMDNFEAVIKEHKDETYSINSQRYHNFLTNLDFSLQLGEAPVFAKYWKKKLSQNTVGPNFLELIMNHMLTPDFTKKMERNYYYGLDMDFSVLQKEFKTYTEAFIDKKKLTSLLSNTNFNLESDNKTASKFKI